MKVKVYVTHYWMSKGIIEYEGEIHHDRYFVGRPVKSKKVVSDNTFSKLSFFEKYEDAVRDVQFKRIKKIESLKRQLEKLEKMEVI